MRCYKHLSRVQGLSKGCKYIRIPNSIKSVLIGFLGEEEVILPLVIIIILNYFQIMFLNA